MKPQRHMIATIMQWFVILGIYAFVLTSSYRTGQQHTFHLLLMSILLVPLCWGLSILLTGKDAREISKHLTPEEREKSIQMERSYGGKMGLFFAGPFAGLCALLRTWGIQSALPYIGLFCIMAILISPFAVHHWKEMRAFMLSTEYARKRNCCTKNPIG